MEFLRSKAWNWRHDPSDMGLFIRLLDQKMVADRNQISHGQLYRHYTIARLHFD